MSTTHDGMKGKKKTFDLFPELTDLLSPLNLHGKYIFFVRDCIKIQ